MILSKYLKHGAPETIIAVLFLTLSFLSPYCHNHDHSSYLYFDTGNHFTDQSHCFDISSDGLPDSHEHNSPHLHLKKDFSGSNSNNSLQNRLHRASLFGPSAYFLSYITIFSGLEPEQQKFKLKNNLARAVSGLSPPVC